MTRRLLLTLIAACLLILAVVPSHVGAWTHCDDPKLREPDCPTTTTKPVTTTTMPVTTTTKPPVAPAAVIVTPKGLTG